ncbi:amidohydrolase family protein [Paenibacillus sp. TRM 82003]|nr:amidohydrolase family protein [Paenibacillus sp. TRM 82003]
MFLHRPAKAIALSKVLLSLITLLIFAGPLVPQLPVEHASGAKAPREVYDVVIRNGRVIDPETNLDQTGLHVGVKDGRIAAVTAGDIQGLREIDAEGLVVAPGFIDILSYDPNPTGIWNKILDGVTTNLAMHGGTSSPASWYRHYKRIETPTHFGASFFYTQARNQLGIGRYASANAKQIEKLLAKAEQSLRDGSMGISFSLEYVPGIGASEIVPMMELAYRYNVPVFFHARYSDMEEPGTNEDALNELIGYARQTKAMVHIDHINSTGGTFSMEKSLQTIADARAEGLDLTACTYPYDFWGTYLNSARFDAGWQERFRIGYGDLQIAGTTERLTAETYRKYRAQGKLAVAYAIPPEDVTRSLQAPFVMVGSDAILEPGFNNHPRASGTFARTVGKYVREEGSLTLMEAVRKMSLLPAQRLEKQVPALQRKGRLAPGMDADIVVFDYHSIRDTATVEHPERPSQGIEYVLIQGRVVKDTTGLQKSVRPGIGLKSEFAFASPGKLKAKWGGLSLPTIFHDGKHYVDIGVIKTLGMYVELDERAMTYRIATATSFKGGVVPPTADLSSPIVDRGYAAVVDEGEPLPLLSIGNRSFLPIRDLEIAGVKVEVQSDSIVLHRE